MYNGCAASFTELFLVPFKTYFIFLTDSLIVLFFKNFLK